MLRISAFKNVYLLPICLLTVMSCFNPFAPELTDKGPNASLILTDQLTPDDVLTNFSYAYNFKDSLVYSDLLDSSFLFISKNFATNPVTDLTWGRDIDIKTTVGLFRHFQSLNLVWEGTIFQYYLDTDSTQTIMKKAFQLTLNGGIETPTIRGEAIFNMIKATPGIWKIIRWEDQSSF